DHYNDYDDSDSNNRSSSKTSNGNSGKRHKDFVELDGRWRSTNPGIIEDCVHKVEDVAQKVKELVLEQRRPSHDHEPDFSDDDDHSSRRRHTEFTDSPQIQRKDNIDNNYTDKKSKDSDFESSEKQQQRRTTVKSNEQSVPVKEIKQPAKTAISPPVQLPKPVVATPQIDLLSSDDFAPFQAAPVTQDADDDFGHFHEATVTQSVQQSPLFFTNPNPTTTTTTTPVSPTSLSLDPFDSLLPSPSSTINNSSTAGPVLKPIPASAATATTQNNQNDFDFFMSTSSQPQIFGQPSSQQFNAFQPQMTTSTSYQSIPKTHGGIMPSNNSFDNMWSDLSGKIDISLNTLSPHSRGGKQQNSLPMNQLTNNGFQSPTSPTSGFSPINSQLFQRPNTSTTQNMRGLRPALLK
ncbi:unnamed protein product, partial [Didymodactylos carnosus]